MNSVIHFLRNEDGPTAVEYAVMLALIIAVCATAVALMGTQTYAAFDNAQTKFGAFMGGS